MDVILLIFIAIAFAEFFIGIDEVEGFIVIMGFCMLLLCGFVLIFAENAKKEAVIKVLNQETKVDTLTVSKDGKIVDIKLID